jgi:2-haloacid dehalogenase
VKPAAVLFDLFGTLLEIGSLRAEVAAITPQAEAFVALWREKQIAYAFASAIMDRYETFDEITGRAAAFAAEKFGVPLAPQQRAALVSAWERVLPYPDAVAALEAVRARGLACCVLTNGTPATATAALTHAGMESAIDTLLSVDSVKVYKPDPRVYALATGHYATTPDRLVFVTSNAWDATGAAAFGFRVAWCNRAGAPAETFGPPPEWTLAGLGELPALLDG